MWGYQNALLRALQDPARLPLLQLVMGTEVTRDDILSMPDIAQGASQVLGTYLLRPVYTSQIHQFRSVFWHILQLTYIFSGAGTSGRGRI